jgi:hypothetical protein
MARGTTTPRWGHFVQADTIIPDVLDTLIAIAPGRMARLKISRMAGAPVIIPQSNTDSREKSCQTY